VPAAGAAPAPGVPPAGPPRRTNPKATWALILGIVGMVLCCLFAGIPAIVLGHQAKGEIDAAPEVQEGRGMATAGFVLGIISTAASVLYIAFIVVVIATDGFGEGL
jgi:peptidoglycan biosynthesis protein MviN/MurJ (putative lipid II flippase)